MIDTFMAAWDMNKGRLEQYFRNNGQSEYYNYSGLVRVLFNEVINPYREAKNTNPYVMNGVGGTTVVDDRFYGGSQIFIVAEDMYQPSIQNHVYTSVSNKRHGDLDKIRDICPIGRPTDEQIKKYMDLCFHILQRCQYMRGD